MKKILIICYDFPPLPSVGAQRPSAWFKHFPSNDIYPIVITRKWKENITNVADYFQKDSDHDEFIEHSSSLLIRSCYKGSVKQKLFNSNNPFKRILRKSITLTEHVFRWHIPLLDETHFLYKAAKKYLTHNSVDLILVTGQPFTLFKYAYKLSQQFNVPYVIDYRDGWATDHAIPHPILKILAFQEKVLEQKYVSSASLCCAASENINIENNKLFPNTKSITHENGIDLKLIEKLKKETAVNQQEFTICYTGSLYDQHNVSDFLKGIDLLINKIPNAQLKVKFIGITLKPSSNIQLIKEFQKKHPKTIEIIDTISHAEAIKAQLSSTLLLKFDYTGQHLGLLGAKLYEYAATKRPILTVLSIENKQTTFFPNRNVQYMVTNKHEICNTIENLYHNFIEGRIIESDLTQEEIYSFSREKRVSDFASVLKKI